MSRKQFVLGLGLVVMVLISVVGCQGTHQSKGEILYNEYCASCHGENGDGLEALIPPLAGADYLAENQDRLPCIIYFGMDGPIKVNGTTYHELMEGSPMLTQIEITNLINYINTAWGNQLPRKQVDEVKALLQACPEDMPVQSR